MLIKYSRDAVKFLDKQPKKTVARIRDAIFKLTLNPPEGDIILMQGYTDSRKRLRIGSWRVIFKFDTENLLIIDIGNRGNIYK